MNSDDNKDVYIHPTSLVDAECVIGKSTRIWQFCNIMKDVVIGENCNIGQGVFIEDGVVLGNRVKVKNNVALYAGVECGDDVFLGPNCVFTNVKNPRSFIEKKSEFRKTYIGQGATIGANATIICGIKIGCYAFIGAGAVVTKDVESYALIVGNPGRQIGHVCKCGETIYGELGKYTCPKCGEGICFGKEW